MQLREDYVLIWLVPIGNSVQYATLCSVKIIEYWSAIACDNALV